MGCSMGATTRQQRPSKRRPVMVSPLDPFDPSRQRMSIVRARKLEQLQREMRARALWRTARLARLGVIHPLVRWWKEAAVCAAALRG